MLQWGDLEGRTQQSDRCRTSLPLGRPWPILNWAHCVWGPDCGPEQVLGKEFYPQCAGDSFGSPVSLPDHLSPRGQYPDREGCGALGLLPTWALLWLDHGYPSLLWSLKMSGCFEAVQRTSTGAGKSSRSPKSILKGVDHFILLFPSSITPDICVLGLSSGFQWGLGPPSPQSPEPDIVSRAAGWLHLPLSLLCLCSVSTQDYCSIIMNQVIMNLSSHLVTNNWS